VRQDRCGCNFDKLLRKREGAHADGVVGGAMSVEVAIDACQGGV
jgi:hypothetical protein